MLDTNRNLIYLHIPKTGGNSVNRAFGVDWENHKDLARYAREIGDAKLRDYFKFAIVRNPWDRLYSDYNYQVRKGRARATKLYLYDGDRRRNFREWVATVLADPFQYKDEAWGGEVSPGIHRWSPQVDWISLNGAVAVDHVAHLETLDRDFARVWQKAGLAPQTLQRRNRRLHFHYSYYYDTETRQRVSEYYKKDIETFGYRFEGFSGSILRWFGFTFKTQPVPAAPSASDGRPDSLAA